MSTDDTDTGTDAGEAGWAYAAGDSPPATGSLISATAESFATSEPVWLGFRIGQTSREVESDTKVSGGPVSTQVKASGMTLDYEALLFTGSYEVYKAEGHIFSRRRACGIQISSSVSNVQVDVALDLVSASLAAGVGVATTSTEISAPGVTWKDFIEKLPEPGVLDSAKLAALRDAVQGAFTIMEQHPSALSPQQVTSYLGVDAEENPLAASHSARFALKRIQRGMTLSEALAEAVKDDLDGLVVSEVYHSVLADYSENTEPDAAAKARAGDLLY